MRNSADKISEQRLIEKARDGDAGAFGQIYERHLDPIYRYIYFRVGTIAEAEELTDDVFVRAWEALPGYKKKGHNSLLPWLYRIAHNLLVDHYRRNRLHKETEPLFAVRGHSPSVEEIVSTQEEVNRAVQAVRELDHVEQTILLLRFVEQLPYQEIAEIVDKSEGACRVIQYRALRALRDLLQQEKADG